MKKLVFATHNKDKLKEVKQLLHKDIELLSLDDIRCFEEIPETSGTVKGNAQQKANYVYTNYHLDCFADDTGLEIEALGGEPGVYSARYAGADATYSDNVNKVLNRMLHVRNRKACFKTVICLIQHGEPIFFEGLVNGTITQEPRGEGGFGYDPVFVPDGFAETFAEIPLQEKNKISHRSMVVHKLMDYLNKAK